MAVDLTWRISLEAVTGNLDKQLTAVANRVHSAAKEISKSFDHISATRVTKAINASISHINTLNRLLANAISGSGSNVDWRPLGVRLKRVIETAVRLAFKTVAPQITNIFVEAMLKGITPIVMAIINGGKEALSQLSKLMARTPIRRAIVGEEYAPTRHPPVGYAEKTIRGIFGGGIMGRTVTQTLVGELFPIIGLSWFFYRFKTNMLEGVRMWKEAAREIAVTTSLLRNIRMEHVTTSVSELGSALEQFTGVDAERASRLISMAMLYTRSLEDATKIVSMGLNLEALRLTEAENFVEMIGKAGAAEQLMQLRRMLAGLGIKADSITSVEAALKQLAEASNGVAVSVFTSANGLNELAMRQQNFLKMLGQLAVETGIASSGLAVMAGSMRMLATAVLGVKSVFAELLSWLVQVVSKITPRKFGFGEFAEELRKTAGIASFEAKAIFRGIMQDFRAAAGFATTEQRQAAIRQLIGRERTPEEEELYQRLRYQENIGIQYLLERMRQIEPTKPLVGAAEAPEISKFRQQTPLTINFSVTGNPVYGTAYAQIIRGPQVVSTW